jgi:hypothetical protein
MAGSRIEIDKQALTRAIRATATSNEKTCVYGELEKAYKHFSKLDQEDEGLLPLGLAAFLGNYWAVHWLLNPPRFSFRSVPDINQVGSGGNTALSAAVQFTDLDSATETLYHRRHRHTLNFVLAQRPSFTLHVLCSAAERGNLVFIKNNPQCLHHQSLWSVSSLLSVMEKAVEGGHEAIILHVAGDFKDFAGLVENAKKILMTIFKRNKNLGQQVYNLWKDILPSFKTDDLLREILPDCDLAKWLIETYQIPMTWKLLKAALPLANNVGLVTYIKEHANFAEEEITQEMLIEMLPDFTFIKKLLGDEPRELSPKFILEVLKLENNASMMAYIQQYFSFKNASEDFLLEVLPYFDFLKWLVETAKVTTTCNMIYRAIHLDHQTVNLLINYYNLMSPDSESEKLVLAAAIKDDYELVNILLAAGASGNCFLEGGVSLRLCHFLRAYCSAGIPEQFHFFAKNLAFLSLSDQNDILKLFQHDKKKFDFIQSKIAELAPVVNASEEGQFAAPGGIAVPFLSSSSAVIQQLMPTVLSERKEEIESENNDVNAIDAESDLHLAFQLLNHTKMTHFWQDPSGQETVAKLRSYLHQKISWLKQPGKNNLAPSFDNDSSVASSSYSQGKKF